ncbi:MAG: efflux RND transporter periplasmic adaptor subunit [Bryobacterales bacterium]|nr:efflux RND transporter periplasmic adaptor subunit [Bryobacterales bacterium]
MRAVYTAAVAVVVCTLAACSGPYSQPKVAAKDDGPALRVNVERVAVSNIPEVIVATGELFAEELATVSAKVPGRVTKLYVDLGSQVTQGQVIAELEKDDYDVRVKQAEALVAQTRARLGILDKNTDEVNPEETATVRQAAAALKEARFIFQTTERLTKEGVVSRIDFEKAQVRAQGAEAGYQAAIEEIMQLRAQLAERRAQLALARQQLGDSVIRAPFSGAVTRRQASQGEYLAVNSPVILLVRQHPIRIRLEIPERQALKVRVGQQIDVKLEGTDKTRTGRVARLSPAFEATNRSLLIEGEIPNQDGALRPGSFVEGTVTVNPNAMGVSVPFNALLTFAGTERVFLANKGVLEEKVVKTGRRLANDRVEVVDGVANGDVVVLNSTDRMVRGQRVSVN